MVSAGPATGTEGVLDGTSRVRQVTQAVRLTSVSADVTRLEYAFSVDVASMTGRFRYTIVRISIGVSRHVPSRPAPGGGTISAAVFAASS